MQSPGTEAQGACQPLHLALAPAGCLSPIPCSLPQVLLSPEPGAAYLLPLGVSPCPLCLTFPLLQLKLEQMGRKSSAREDDHGEWEKILCSGVSPGGATSGEVRLVDGLQPDVPSRTA